MDLNHSVVKINVQILKQDVNMPWKIIDISSATGTGFFIDKKGYILTCYHVVSNSDPKYITINIPANGNQYYKAVPIKFFPNEDIALLKTEFKPKKFLRLGNSSSIKRGQIAEAIGFPLGSTLKSLKITKGVISGRNGMNFQIDTPINPGNSGGPLIVKGKVIGINKSIIKYSSNIGFSTMINKWHQLKKESLKTKDLLFYSPQLYIHYNEMNLEYIQYKKLKGGILIRNIFSELQFNGEKLKKDDIVYEINKFPINFKGDMGKDVFGEKYDIYDFFASLPISKEYEVKFLRKNAHLKTKIITKPNITLPINSYNYPYENVDYLIIGGLVIIPLTRNYILENLKMKDLTENLTYPYAFEKKYVLSKILPGTNISLMENLEEGDIITKINDEELKNLNIDIHEKLKSKFIKIESHDNVDFLPSSIIKNEINNVKRIYQLNYGKN